MPKINLDVVSGIKESTGVNMTVALPDSHMLVKITEDRSNTLVVPECRIRSGYREHKNQFLDQAYRGKNKPNKVYLSVGTGNEINNPVEGSVIISQGECRVVIETRIAREEENKPIKAFTVFCKYGLTATHPKTVLVRSDGNDNVVTQVFSINYTDNSEFGCVVFRCVNEKLSYSKDNYKQHEMLTVYFHRTRSDYENAPYPPVITLTNLQEQNYVPLVPGQILQIIPNTGEVIIEGCLDKADPSLSFINSEPINKSKKLWVYRYECLHISTTTEPLFLKGEQTCSVIVPPILFDDDEIFSVISHPCKTAKIVCCNITSFRLRFVKDIPIVQWPAKMIEIPSMNSVLHELKLKLLKTVESVYMVNDNDICSMSCTLPGYGIHSTTTQK
jgi:hypothetical protein